MCYEDTLYKELKHLTETTDAFYSVETSYESTNYVIFNYRLASYTDFLKPSALESRGIMFRVSVDGVYLVSYPPQKFFNLHENPFTEGIDLTAVDTIMEKMDGSLISSYYHCNGIKLKSKGALQSFQAVEANKLLESTPDLFELVSDITSQYRCTINFEWTAPENRIVVPYTDSELTILNVRLHNGGQYAKKDSLVKEFGDVVEKYWVNLESTDCEETFVKAIPDMNGNKADPVIEGFVVSFSNGDLVKIKTDRYCRLHHSKDEINSDKKLFEIVLYEQSDDLKSFFYYDELAIKRITAMEEFVSSAYNIYVKNVEMFYGEHRIHKTKKEYVEIAKRMLTSLEFSTAMKLYDRKDVDYKEMMLRQRDGFLKNFKV